MNRLIQKSLAAFLIVCMALCLCTSAIADGEVEYNYAAEYFAQNALLSNAPEALYDEEGAVTGYSFGGVEMNRYTNSKIKYYITDLDAPLVSGMFRVFYTVGGVLNVYTSADGGAHTLAHYSAEGWMAGAVTPADGSDANSPAGTLYVAQESTFHNVERKPVDLYIYEIGNEEFAYTDYPDAGQLAVFVLPVHPGVDGDTETLVFDGWTGEGNYYTGTFREIEIPVIESPEPGIQESPVIYIPIIIEPVETTPPPVIEDLDEPDIPLAPPEPDVEATIGDEPCEYVSDDVIESGYDEIDTPATGDNSMAGAFILFFVAFFCAMLAAILWREGKDEE